MSNKILKDIKQIVKYHKKYKELFIATRGHKDILEDIETIEQFEKVADLDIMPWGSISFHCKLSEEFIRKFKNKVNWYSIGRNQKLSENFIREFKNKVNWYYISTYQKLSQKFIREFKDKVDFRAIYDNQKLSPKFIEEFIDKFLPFINCDYSVTMEK